MPHPNARIPDFWPAGKPWTFDRPDTPVDVNLDKTVEKWGDRIGITYNGADYTYQEIADRVSAMAGYLQHAGLAKGDRVLLYTQNCPQYIIAFYAILRAGGAVVPVNPMNKRAEIDYLVEDTGATIAVCALELANNILPALERGDLKTLIGTRMTDMGLPDFDL
ncbi:MAG: AMP-binding protein, partial [Shimia sp.]|nr:AMP-binding protein [Shimia sp.]